MCVFVNKDTISGLHTEMLRFQNEYNKVETALPHRITMSHRYSVLSSMVLSCCHSLTYVFPTLNCIYCLKRVSITSYVNRVNRFDEIIDL